MDIDDVAEKEQKLYYDLPFEWKETYLDVVAMLVESALGKNMDEAVWTREWEFYQSDCVPGKLWLDAQITRVKSMDARMKGSTAIYIPSYYWT